MIYRKKRKMLSAFSAVIALFIGLSSANTVSALSYDPIKMDYIQTSAPESESAEYFRVNIFDYNRENPEQIAEAIKKEYPKAKRSSYFSFIGGGSSESGFSMISQWTGHNGGIIKNLVAPNKTSSSPSYSEGITGIDLFDTNSSYYDVYENVWFPFRYENGKYVYDSEFNSATLDTNSGIISLGNPNGGFWPFGVDKYHFGMHLSVDFYIPDGKSVDGEDLVFNFSGDDDVWVYIDGKLVLDVGGIHDAYSGSINFTNATVSEPKAFATYPNMHNPSKPTVTYNEFIASFEENSIHTLEIFYLERGASKSDCRIEFNLPKYEPLIIKKEISNLNSEADSNTEFVFNIKTANNFECKEDLANYVGEYDLYENNIFIERKTTDQNGNFILKNNQEAKFDTLLAETYFEITEISASEDDFYTYFSAADWIIQNDLIVIDNGTIKGILRPDVEMERSYEITCENIRKTTDFCFNKVDSYTMQPISGSEFSLCGTSDLQEKIDITSTSDANGIVCFENIPQGKYTLKEIQAGEGYVLNEAIYEIEININKDGIFEMLVSYENEIIYSGNTSEVGFYVTNDPEIRSITVQKIWNDENNAHNTRPYSITVNLLADGIKIMSQEITAENNWEYTFENLSVYNNGKKIEYTVTENNVVNYKTSYDGYTITNTYTPPIPTPDTSDNSYLFVFIVTALISIAAATVFIILKKKQLNKDNNI